MDWYDGLKVRPIRDGGIYVLAAPAQEDGVEVKLGTYNGSWYSGGQLTPVVYFSEVTDLPADAAAKAKVLREALQEAAKEEPKAMPADRIEAGKMPEGMETLISDRLIAEDPELEEE